MWEYFTTSSAASTNSASTASANSLSSSRFRDVGVSADDLTVYSSSSVGAPGLSEASWASSWEQTYDAVPLSTVGAGDHQSQSQLNSIREVLSTNLTRHVTQRTTFTSFSVVGDFPDWGSGQTTFSSQQTFAAQTRDSYASSTVATTTNTTWGTTTSVSSTTTQATTTAGPVTTTATTTTTVLTSTGASGSVNSSTYTHAASTTLSAPAPLVGISEALPTEQAWDITAPTHTAGFPGALGTTFTKRTGTLATSSVAVPVVPHTTFTTTHEVATTTSSQQLTTTATTTTADTYLVPGDRYPLTATSTREFPLLTTRTTSFSAASWTPVTTTHVGPSASRNTAGVTFSTRVATPATITYNLSPTATSTAAVSFTHTGTSSRNRFRQMPEFATSASALQALGGAGNIFTTRYTTTTATAETNTTTTALGPVDTTTTAATTTTWANPFYYAETQAGSFTESTALNTASASLGGWSPGTESYRDETAWWSTSQSFYSIDSRTTVITGGTEYHTTLSTTYYTSWYTESYSAVTYTYTTFIGGDGYAVQNTFTSSSTESFTSSETFSATESFLTTANVFETTTTTTAATTVNDTVTTTTTATTAVNSTTSVGTVVETANQYTTSSSAVEGISYTYPLMHPQETHTCAEATASAHHQELGFRHPLSLAPSASLFSSLSVTGGPSFYYPLAATQDDVSGARTPLLDPEARTFASGSSVYTAAWDLTASRLDVTTGVTDTTTGTALVGAATVTTTQTITTATASGAASFSGEGSATYFAARVTSSATERSAIGGVPSKPEFAARVVLPAGAHHLTRQSAGTSSSSFTTWQQSATVLTDTSVGFALPTRSETAVSVFARETFASVSHTNNPLRGLPFGWVDPLSIGAAVRPVVIVSKHPDL